jgi:hypothetical protein
VVNSFLQLLLAVACHNIQAKTAAISADSWCCSYIAEYSGIEEINLEFSELLGIAYKYWDYCGLAYHCIKAC